MNGSYSIIETAVQHSYKFTFIGNTTMQSKFLKELSTLDVTAASKLKQYIQFCTENNKNERIKGKTSHHHILPRSLFEQYSNLKEHPWNGTHLLYADHYYAHWLFTEAINDYGQMEAFCKMHNCDIKLGRITENELISSVDFQIIMEKTIKKSSELRLSTEWKETIGKEKIRKMVETKSSEEWKNTIGKLSKIKQVISLSRTMNSDIWKETTGADKIRKQKETKSSKKWKNTVGIEQSEKHKNTVNSEEWKNTVGIEQTRKARETKKKNNSNERGGKKCSETKNSKTWKDTIGKNAISKHKNTINSNEWKNDIGKEQTRKRLATMQTVQSKTKRYDMRVTKSILKYGAFDLYDYNDNLVYTKMSKIELKYMSATLHIATKEKPLGYTNATKAILNKIGKLNLIGYYVINKKLI